MTAQMTTEVTAQASPTRFKDLTSDWDGHGLVTALIGLAALAVLTGMFVASGSVYLYTYNTFLFASIGAISLNVLMGTSGLVSLGNPAFMLVGAFTVVISRDLGLSIPVALLASMVFAAAIGALVGLPAIRLRGLELALATIAGFFILRQLASQYQHNHGGGTIGFYFTPGFASKGLQGAQTYWAWTLLAVVAVVVLMTTAITRHRSGRAWRMLRDHDSNASALGIPVVRYKLLAFALTSAIIGLQGGLFAYFTGSVTFEYFTFDMAVLYLAMVMIGGLDSVAGSVVGAGIVVALPVLVPKVVSGTFGDKIKPSTSGAIATILYGVLIVIFAVTAQHGVVGLARAAWKRVRELFVRVRSR